ncbi:metal-dependent hydrolase [bacterium]|nr:metal-dependent hydrolase [bacterium]
MNPITHALLGWTISHPLLKSKRDIALVTLGSVIPDIDGAGIIADFFSQSWPQPLSLYSDYHHTLGHNLFAAFLFSICAGSLAREKLKTFASFFLVFHLHLICDVAGSKGPDGEQWPIFYFFPINRDWKITWSGQWEVNAWQNMLVTVISLLVALNQARKNGFSPIWFFSRRADAAFVETLRARFPLKESGANKSC